MGDMVRGEAHDPYAVLVPSATQSLPPTPPPRRLPSHDPLSVDVRVRPTVSLSSVSLCVLHVPLGSGTRVRGDTPAFSRDINGHDTEYSTTPFRSPDPGPVSFPVLTGTHLPNPWPLPCPPEVYDKTDEYTYTSKR